MLVSFMELKNNIEKIRVEHLGNQKQETKFLHQNNTNPDDIKKHIINKGELFSMKMHSEKAEKGNDHWRIIERKNSYNNELQFYSTNNVELKDERIVITSKKETKEDNEYTSGLVESTNAYKYGFFEFTIQVDEGKGLFPAIWLLPINDEPLPEVDIFEMIGSEPQIFYGVVHYKENGGQYADYFEYEVSKKQQYSVALKWTQENLLWIIDEQEVYATSKGVPNEYMFLIINQAIGGNWPGNPDESTIFPNKFKILSYKIEPIFMKGRD